MTIPLLAVLIAVCARWRRTADELRETKEHLALYVANCDEQTAVMVHATMELLRRDGQVRNLRKLTQRLMGGRPERME